jgi:transposase
MSGVDLSTGQSNITRLSDCPTPADIASWAEKWATKPVRFVYESGPCGIQLARDLRQMGYACDMIAVSSIPRSNQAKIRKDDRIDADALLDAILSPKSKCRVVWVPSEEHEATKDLVRAYHDEMQAVKDFKLRLTALLLRHGYVWNQKTPTGKIRATWGREYMAWLNTISFSKDTDARTLFYYKETVLLGIERCNQMKSELSVIANNQDNKPYIDALTRLKGVDELTALAFHVTVDDYSRFRNGRSVTSYFGLVPSRHDSGENVGRNGGIAKTGDTTVRKAVIEGLASLPNFVGHTKYIRKGHEVSPEIEAEATKCNARNKKRYDHLVRSGKRANVAKVAVAGELVRQMWVLGSMIDKELGR